MSTAANGSIVEQIRDDYSHFPYDQSYELYAEDVYFKDPLNEFRGLTRYKWMIGLIKNLFSHHQLDLHDVSQPGPNQMVTRWTLSMTAPLPWQPRLSIPGRSELGLNKQGVIVSHVDYWDCSRLDVLRQVWQRK